MKKLLPLLFTINVCLVSCNNGDTTSAKDTTDSSKQTTVAPEHKPAAETTCYASVAANDTVRLSINKMGEAVTGSLIIKYSGKDANNGTLSGTMQGDTLLADYTFQSEGVQSVRQVVFLKKGKGFVQGYGDVEERGGKTVFKNRGALNFNEKMFLSEVSCTQ